MITHWIKNIFQKQSTEDKKLAQAIQHIIGRKPKNLSLYQLAVSHTSVSKVHPNTGVRESNERLEYLGDAVLGIIVAEYLFKKFPFKDEGFLTEIRSRIVNRESLNDLSRKIGLYHLIRYENIRRSAMAYRSIAGDALEALVGAVYLDMGFTRCKFFVLDKLIKPHFDLDKIVGTNKNFKSIVVEWAQRESKEVRFEIIEERGSKHQREFIAQVFIGDAPISKGSGLSKKKAEQAAAEKCCELLQI
ncbi:MAG: ribonuclease III [Cytophagales bacterium]|nr:MAG: ribonuclease III [Cytophagales bacterium]